MDEHGPTIAATVAAIEADYGNWGAWLSDTGNWWATRRRPLSTDEQNAGCVQFVQADTPEGLRERIADEEQMAARLAGRHGTRPGEHDA